MRAPARLHFGFLDMNGSLGRRFGGLGVGIEELGVSLRAERARDIQAEGPGAERAVRFAERLLAGTGKGVRIVLSETIPGHAGLGSGTQMALAVGMALGRLYGWPSDAEDLAWRLGRGRRSGIGVHTFRLGGFIVDAGRGALPRPPGLVARLPVPDSWRFVLVMDRARKGLSGDRERDAFTRLGQMSGADAAELCRIVLMQVLPALAEYDCATFGAGITRIQQIVGAHFAPAQAGLFTSPAVEEALRFLQEAGATGIGQSSWGPTGFAIFASETGAHQAVRAVRSRYSEGGPDLVICRAQNRPALIRDQGAATAAARPR